MIRSRFPDIVYTAPDELPHAESALQVFRNHLLQVFSTPACIAVSQGTALQVCLTHYALFNREMINSPAAQHTGGFAPVDHPVRMFPVMLFIQVFSVIVSCDLYEIRTSLPAFPRHVIASERNRSVRFRIMGTHLVHQHPADFGSAKVCMHIVNFISDRPHHNTRMNTVTPYPCGYIVLPAGREKASIIVFRLGTLPHIKCFIIYKDPEFIAQIQQL